VPREEKPLPPKPMLPLEERPEAEQIFARRRAAQAAAGSDSESEESGDEPAAKRAHVDEGAAAASLPSAMPGAPPMAPPGMPPMMPPGYYGVRHGEASGESGLRASGLATAHDCVLFSLV
jgi:hypothetical protein